MNTALHAKRIARQLADCEQNVDILMAGTASLLVEMANARVASDSFGTGQRAIARIVEAQRALAGVQSDLMRAHADLLKIGQERGDMLDGDCPPRGQDLSVAA